MQQNRYLPVWWAVFHGVERLSIDCIYGHDECILCASQLWGKTPEGGGRAPIAWKSVDDRWCKFMTTHCGMI